MIKKVTCFVILIFSCYLDFGQSFDCSLLPNQNKFHLLLIGENHFNYEKDTVELDIIKWYAHNSSKKITIFIERPYSMQLFVDKLFNSGDSELLKQYLIYSYDRTSNVFITKEQNLYGKILDIYELNKTTKNIKIKCIDRELYLKSMLFSIKDVLIKYKSPKVQQLINEIDRYLIKEIVTMQDYEFLRSFYKLNCKYYFLNFKNSIKTSDIYYINEVFDGFKPMISNSETRESFLYHKMINNWEENTFFISINGLAHVNKFFSKTDTIIGNRKSIGYLLNTNEDSPFVNNVKSLGIVSFYLKSSKKTEKVKNSIYFMTKDEKSYLYTLSKNKKQLINLDSTKFKFASKAYDLLILVDTSHSSVNH